MTDDRQKRLDELYEQVQSLENRMRAAGWFDSPTAPPEPPKQEPDPEEEELDRVKDSIRKLSKRVK